MKKYISKREEVVQKEGGTSYATIFYPLEFEHVSLAVEYKENGKLFWDHTFSISKNKGEWEIYKTISVRKKEILDDDDPEEDVINFQKRFEESFSQFLASDAKIFNIDSEAEIATKGEFPFD